MPGVGVAPGFIGFRNSASLGMPGVDVPFGSMEFAFELSAVFAPSTMTGFVEIPGGIFAGSSFTSAGLRFALAFAAASEFAGDVPPQPNKNKTKRQSEKIIKFLNIMQFS